jgi:hypothetical protein
MIYGVNRNGKRGIGYIEPKIPNAKPKLNVLKPKRLYSHFTLGHNKSTKHNAKIHENHGNSDKKGPKRI